MSKQIQENTKKVKDTLLKQQAKVEAELKALEQEDPVMDNILAESSEPGTDSWLADMHGRAVAVRGNLQSILNSTKKALSRLNSGKYGKCEKCGKDIEAARLKAMPTATRCMSCSKKAAK